MRSKSKVLITGAGITAAGIAAAIAAGAGVAGASGGDDTEQPITGADLQRALDAIPAEAKETADPGIKAFIEGVELTERSLLNSLEKNGVKKFDPSGEKFDPNFQQAMYEVPDPSVPSGTVVQVVQAGFMIGERVLRPALVAVSKGGAKAAPAADAAN